MQEANKLGFLSALLLILLLPIIFLPTQLVPTGVVKSAVLVIGAIVIFGSILYKVWKEKGITLPSSHVLWAALLLPAVYVLSALMSQAPALSMFGYVLESGTAASIILFGVLMFVAAILFHDHSKLIRALSMLFVSFALVALLSFIKIISKGTWLNLGVLGGNTSNPIGGWTDLAVAFGLLAMLSTFALEMLPLKGVVRIVAWVTWALSVVLLVIVNYSTAWILTLGGAAVLLVYFLTVENGHRPRSSSRPGVWITGGLVLLSVLLLWNPTIASKNIATRISEATSVANAEVRPNLSSTMNVSRAVLGSHVLLGAGPNTFSKSWLQYKSSETNNTPFWNIAFPFGFGFLTTVPATVGLLGALIWLAFLALFIRLGVRAITHSGEVRSDRFMIASTFIISLYLWIGSFLYTPSIVMLSTTFISTGLFIGACAATGVIKTRRFDLNKNKISHFASVIVIVLLAVGTLAFGYSSAKRVLAAFHYEKALAYSATASGKTINDVESELGRAITFAPADQYWSAVSQVELSRANSVLNSTSGNDTEKQTTFQNALSASIAALQNALALNLTYSNWINLGNVYESLVAEPLAVDGAYESAQAAYKEALKLNPETPEIPLLLARLELDKKNVEAARADIKDALSKKQDYADAYFLLSQLEVSQNHITQAIKSAETGVVLSPGNAGVQFELGLLKYANKDYPGAREAFVKALGIVGNYANAEYYLGLTDDKLGKKDEAIKIFEDLAQKNPDNQLVTQVLTNLRAGRGALTDTTPAPSNTTKTAPITGQ